MKIVSVENVSKSFTEKKLLDNVSFYLSEGEKIGIVGINGVGKSTFLKLIAAVEHLDSGVITISNKWLISYLSQSPKIDPNATVLEQIFLSEGHGIPIIKEYQLVLKQIEEGQDLTDKLLEIQEKIDRFNLWDLESQAKTILSKLGIIDYQQLIKNLSGGEQKRVFLAQTLITPSDLLILDEPTNHLDSESIEWLELFLSNRKQALLMVTHDRYFLDKVVNKIIEIENGNIYQYQGNYSLYVEQKILREEQQSTVYQKQKSLYQNELKWIRRGPLARGTKQKARIDRFEQLKGNLHCQKKEDLEFSVIGARLGKKIIELENVSKSYLNLKLITDFSYVMQRDERIGIVGKNGTGKSTLLNMIEGTVNPDSGTIVKGETVSIGYFKQEIADMNLKTPMIKYLEEEAKVIKLVNGETITAGKMLEKFLFEKNNHYTPIAKLSGGEKRRLALLKIFMANPNVILLDEPTNDFDTTTLAVLENFIDNFKGVVIVVSHDRYFLNRICNKIFAYGNDGKIEVITGNYDDYLIRKPKGISVKKTIQKEIQKNQAKLSYLEKKELAVIDDVIEEIENKIGETKNLMIEHSTDYEKIKIYSEVADCLEKELEEKFQRWEYLSKKN